MTKIFGPKAAEKPEKMSYDDFHIYTPHQIFEFSNKEWWGGRAWTCRGEQKWIQSFGVDMWRKESTFKT